MQPLKLKRLSEEFADLAAFCRRRSFTYADLTQKLSSRGHALTSLILATPFLLPIPLPGLSQVLGFFIIIAGIELAINKRPWIPTRLLMQRLPAELLAKLFLGCSRVMAKLERFIRPRGKFLQGNLWLRQVNGFVIALSGLLLALPLPPGTNFPPAIVIVTLSIAILEDDGLFMIICYLMLTLILVVSFLVAVFGWKGLQAMLQMILP